MDGIKWNAFTNSEWKTRKLRNYQIGSELFHSVDQNPGISSNHCELSDAEVLSGSVWSATAITSSDMKICDYDKNGSKIYPTTSDEWAYDNVSAQGFEMWDKKVEY